MNFVLRFLFSSNLTYPGTWEEENALGSLSETVQLLAGRLKAVQPELWAEYWQQAEALRDLERWAEFERGFLMGVQLMVEAMKQPP